VFTLVEFGDQSSFQDAVILDGHGASNRINHGNHFAVDKVRCNAGANLDTGTVSGLDESNALLTCIYNGSSTDIRINGVSKVTGNVGSAQWAGVSCGTNSSASVFWDQKMLEIIVYNRLLTSAEILEVEAYLNDKWGL
jgi:hypothetical protein